MSDFWVAYEDGYRLFARPRPGAVQVRVSQDWWTATTMIMKYNVVARGEHDTLRERFAKAYRAGWNIESLSEFYRQAGVSYKDKDIREELLNESETAWDRHEALWQRYVENNVADRIYRTQSRPLEAQRRSLFN